MVGGMRTKPIRPITPEEAKYKIKNAIPQAIIKAVNECIAENFRNKGSVTILQKDIIEKALIFDNRLTSDIIFEKKYLDFEDLYQEAGWKVTYDKPAYNETFEAYFKFEPQKK